MIPGSASIPAICAWLGILSALLAPFAFGASTLRIWVPLAYFWIALGLCTLVAQAVVPPKASIDFNPAPRVMLAIHALIAFQSIPLPEALLRVVSPGSFAAHFLPPGEHAFAPLTASPTGTVQAWLFIAGLHGLVVAIFSASREVQRRRLNMLLAGMAVATAVLAVEGLIQAASAHPYRLYGIFEVPGAGDFERAIFGPYYNRDHYSNIMAMGGSVVAALLGQAARGPAFKGWTAFVNSPRFARHLGLMAALLLIVVASAAAGSRGGLIALGVGLAIGFGPLFLARPRLALGVAVLLFVVLFGAGIPAAFMRMADVDFEASRLLVWRDMVRVVTFFPIFGCGIGGFAVAYWPYQRVVRYEYWPHAHNEYLQWILEAGVIGLLIAAFVVRSVWLAAPRIVRSVEARPALAALLATMTHALVDLVMRIPANAAWAALLLAGVVVAIAAPPASEETRDRPGLATTAF